MGLTTCQKLEWLLKNDPEIYDAIEKIIERAYDYYRLYAEKNKIKSKKI